MLVQPIQSLVAGRDFPSSTLHLCQHGERFGYELENALPVSALMLTSSSDIKKKVLIVFFLKVGVMLVTIIRQEVQI